MYILSLINYGTGGTTTVNISPNINRRDITERNKQPLAITEMTVVVVYVVHFLCKRWNV